MADRRSMKSEKTSSEKSIGELQSLADRDRSDSVSDVFGTPLGRSLALWSATVGGMGYLVGYAMATLDIAVATGLSVVGILNALVASDREGALILVVMFVAFMLTSMGWMSIRRIVEPDGEVSD